MDLNRDGSHSAIIEYVGPRDSGLGLDYRLAIVDLESGDRRYLSVPVDIAVVPPSTCDYAPGFWVTVQYSPANDWILLFDGQPHGRITLIGVDTGTRVPLPVSGRVLAAGWWPKRSPDSIALVLAEDNGLILACFDCATAELDLVGPIKSQDYSAPDLQYPQSSLQQYVDLRAHPNKNLALVGATEGRDRSSQSESAPYRVAQLNLDTCEITPLCEPFVAGDHRFQRSHASWRWIETARPIQLTIHDKLIESAESATQMELPRTSVDSDFADDARRLLNCTALTVIRHVMRQLGHGEVEVPDIRFLRRSQDGRREEPDVRYLRPEVLRAYEACMQYGMPDDFHKWMRDIVPWLSTNDLALGCNLPGLTRLVVGLEAIQEGKYHEWDWAADRRG